MDDDLFDVFDSESSKSKRIVLPSAEDETEPTKVDPDSLIKEICGAKRPGGGDDEKDEGAESKKIKTDEPPSTIMTGMSDLEVKSKIESDDRQTRQVIDEPEPENLEEDETVISLVESAPR